MDRCCDVPDGRVGGAAAPWKTRYPRLPCAPSKSSVDRLETRRSCLTRRAFPSAAAALILFYWLETAPALALGIAIFGVIKASVPALVVALAQDTAPPGNAGAAAGIIMSLHYFSGVVAPLIAAQIIAATGDIIIAMILTTSVPLILYGALISAVREGARR